MFFSTNAQAFQLKTYENMCNKINKTHKFQHCWGKKLHVTWSLPIVWHKMLKVQLVIKLMDCTLVGNPKGIPPTMNCNILCGVCRFM
jgi:hypothetical protein